VVNLLLLSMLTLAPFILSRKSPGACGIWIILFRLLKPATLSTLCILWDGRQSQRRWNFKLSLRLRETHSGNSGDETVSSFCYYSSTEYTWYSWHPYNKQETIEWEDNCCYIRTPCYNAWLFIHISMHFMSLIDLMHITSSLVHAFILSFRYPGRFPPSWSLVSTSTRCWCHSHHTWSQVANAKLRSATTHVARVQTCLTHSVQVAQPSQEAFEAETVTTVWRGAVPRHYH